MLVTEPAVAVNAPLVAPAATVTDPGTLRAALLSDRPTPIPPAGAAPDIVTVHVEIPPGSKLAGKHCSPVTVAAACDTLIVPPLPDTAIELPSASAPIVLLMGTETAPLLLAATVAVTTATTPLPIVFPFTPDARHVTDPLVELQFSVLPAAVSAGPATAPTEVSASAG